MKAVAGTPRSPIQAFGIATGAAMIAGVLACLWWPGRMAGGWMLPVLPVGLWLWRAHGHRRAAMRRVPAAGQRLAGASLVGAFLVGFALAGLHAAHALSLRLPAALDKRDVVVRGRIVELPQHEARRTRFLFRVEPGGSRHAALSGRLLRLAWYDEGRDPVRAGPRWRLRAGERWSLPVRLRAPRGLRNPGGVDSEKYALAQRLTATGYVRAPDLAIRLSAGSGIEAWRETMSSRIATGDGGAASRFVRALALGDTRALSDEDWTTLRAVGLTHLIAISGFHVGLVAAFFALLARGLWFAVPGLAGRWPLPIGAAVAAVAGAALYSAVAGFALPTVRTLLMIAVVAGARVLRRPVRTAQSLALAATAVVLVDPLAVLGAGFWLSFMGVAWLLWCLPRSGDAASGPGAVVGGFLSAQGVATVGLLPLGVVLFGQASLAGPFANLVAVPWWSLVVVPLALLGLAAEMLFPGAGTWFWIAAGRCFELSWPLFERLAQGGLAVWWLPEPAWHALPLALAGAFWLLLPRGVPGKVLAVLLWLPLLWPDRDLPGVGEADLTVIDVGQGLSVLVRTSGHALLYDMGPAVEDGFDAGERAVVPALHALGVGRLDLAVVSHGDQDHAGGLEAVRREFPIDAIRSPEGAGIAAAESPCRAGQHWEWDGVRFEFLHPPPHFPYLANESSCVLRVQSRHGIALLTGDIGEVIERRLVQRLGTALKSDVVVIAHHGSSGSSDPGFVAVAAPRLALVSSGHGNRFGHPKPEVLARWQRAGARTLDTAASGALRVGLREGGIRAETRRSAQPRLWDAAAAR